MARRSKVENLTEAERVKAIGQIMTQALIIPLAADLARGAIARERQLRTVRPKGGRTRGKQITATAEQHDPLIKKYFRQWERSAGLQDSYRSGSAYVKAKTGLPMWKIQRRIKALGLRNSDSS